MLDFKPLNVSDRDWVNDAINKSGFMICESSFANNVAWQRLNGTKACKCDEFCILKSQNDDIFYYDFPFGLNINSSLDDYKRAFSFIFSDAKENGYDRVTITSVTEEFLPVFDNLYKGLYECATDDAHDDYIYLSSDLIELKGKKYHSKRNHISNFKKNNWRFERIDNSNIDDALIYTIGVYNSLDEDKPLSTIAEQYAINTYFTHFDELELCGGILYLDDNIVAVTIGERLNDETFVVHIEKAEKGINGAYPTICNEFLKEFAVNYKYVNREEDLGVEGLRKSKMSYYPCFKIKKYTLTFNTEDLL